LEKFSLKNKNKAKMKESGAEEKHPNFSVTTSHWLKEKEYFEQNFLKKKAIARFPPRTEGSSISYGAGRSRTSGKGIVG
jgi:hypothetical protein